MHLPAISADYYRALRDDIRLRGILVPLIFDQSGKCLDGRVRLKILEELGITEYIRHYINVGDADEVRLAINTLRRQLSRKEMRSNLDWLIKRHPEKPAREIAREAGVSPTTASNRKKAVQFGQSVKPTMIVANTPRQGAEALEALNVVGDSLPSGVVSIRTARQAVSNHNRQERCRNANGSVPPEFSILHGDFRDIFPTAVENGSVSLVVGDPVWSDLDLAKAYGLEVFRILKPRGYALIYTGAANLLRWASAFQDAGLIYRWVVVGVNTTAEGMQGGGAIKYNGSVHICSRQILWFQKGGPFKTVNILRDVIWSSPSDREKTWWKWQQPLCESAEIVRCLTSPGDLIADPTSGSFTVAEAVARVGQGRRFVGCDLEADLVGVGRQRVELALGAAKGETTTGGKPSKEGERNRGVGTTCR